MIRKILKIVGIVIVSIGIVVLLFIKFWPSLGGNVTEVDQKEYNARNSLYLFSVNRTLIFLNLPFAVKKI